MLKTALMSFVVLTLSAFKGAEAQSPYPFVADDFAVPDELVTEEFRLRMLSIHDVVKDYDAVMSSSPHLLTMFPGWGGWPEGLTVQKNLVDLAWHQREFTRRTSFTYTVISLDEAKVLGCVYIFPTRKNGYDADVTFWARESAQGAPADLALEEAVRAWIDEEWPFENAGYPGRDVSWEEWDDHPTSAR